MTEIQKAVERKSVDIVKTLHPLVKEWFFGKFEDFSLTQRYGVAAIWERKDILISAPTGGTKTLTAFLSILNYLVGLAEKNELDNRIYAVYTSPLKALSNDIHKNLVEPLEEINALAKKKGIKLQEIRVGLRTGDTTLAERARMARKAPHIFITTPESLAIVLTTKKFVEYMEMVEFCVVDEIHSLNNKRGTYLSITLERLNDVSKIYPVKIGLSATISPLDEVARYLIGEEKFRNVEVAEVPMNKQVEVKVLTPVGNLIEDENITSDMYSLVDKLVREHKTTLIFTNTRAGTERVVNHLKDKFPTVYGDDNIAAHHSSLSKSLRFGIEERLRDGKLKVVVCSTSLELGIDIGFIDLVIMIGSPKSSARALQRIGRAGHQLHNIAKGRFIVMDRDDLVECSVIQKEMIERRIDKVYFPKNCLDVLSQQIYGMAIYKQWNIDEMFSLIRKSYCFSKLTKNDFFDVISYLSGEYALEKNHVYGKIWYDVESKMIGKRGKLARVIYLTNIGTIPSESFINVKLAPSGERIGMIDEGFLERMKKGDVFVLGGMKYEYSYVRGMNVYVRGAAHRNPTIPSWFSEMLPLSFDSALEINKFRLLMNEKFEQKWSKANIIGFVMKHLYVEEETAIAIYSYFNEQRKFFEIPHSKRILIEKYKGEKNYVLVHSMYGRRVNDALSRALGYLMAQAGGRDIQVGINDNGFYFAGEKMEIEKAFKFLTSENAREVVEQAIEKSDILARRFRHCASRALMILRTYKGVSRSVGKQQMKSHFLLAAVRKISNKFPILNEARREVLEDVMEIENTKKVLAMIEDKMVKIEIKDVLLPSPFALNLILQGHSDLIKIEDKQKFLKRMHELHLKVVGNGN
ncbi:ATP-dependent helicase [Candidatus Pacearchaeota archaeon]|nr:ATP-dependent helicase [Candidatus Pacearchaeota archaeon]|tara:strand:+ start:15909 stop:18494 length:2586 start_codon:yes stop_codon:yes gene_type:complete